MSGTDQLRVARAADATVVAELVYAGADGRIGAERVVPLVADGQVVLALPYGQRPLADALGTADRVALVLSDQRMALRGWEPLVLEGRIEVERDVDGERFTTELLDQELRKHPPSRLLADSLRDRHDHWWFLPRLLCQLRLDDVRGVVAREWADSGVLAWRSPRRLEVETVEVVDADGVSCSLRALSDRALLGAGEPALLFRHDYSQPDLERRSERREHGRLDGSTLRDVERRGELALPPPPRLLERVRRHRAMSKACRAELARDR